MCIWHENIRCLMSNIWSECCIMLVPPQCLLENTKGNRGIYLKKHVLYFSRTDQRHINFRAKCRIQFRFHKLHYLHSFACEGSRPVHGSQRKIMPWRIIILNIRAPPWIFILKKSVVFVLLLLAQKILPFNKNYQIWLLPKRSYFLPRT